MNSINDKFKFLRDMSSLDRYSQTHLTHRESVLEHTGFIVLICYLLGTELNKYLQLNHDPRLATPAPINMGVLLSKGAVHDADEIITGDIPRPTKYYNKGVKAALDQIAIQNMKLISDRLLGDDLMFIDWNNSKSGREGFIVSVADSIAVCYKTWQEVLVCGNRSIVEHATSLEPFLIEKKTQAEKLFGENNPLLVAIDESIIICNEVQKHRVPDYTKITEE